MPLPPITSRDNARLRAIRALAERRGREAQRAYAVEGVTLVLEALAAGIEPILVLRDDSRLSAARQQELDQVLARHDTVTQPVTTAAFRAVAETETPQGVLAVLPLPPSGQAPPPRPNDLYLIVDRVQDPGNLGTMLRAAEGAGVRCVVTTPGTVDLFNPKVVRAGMGAHFRLPLAPEMPWPRVQQVIGQVLPLLGADASARRAYDAIDWSQGAALVIGNEAAGLGDEARATVSDLIAIPLHGKVESLNAGIATAVILFEAARQRRQAGSRVRPHPAR